MIHSNKNPLHYTTLPLIVAFIIFYLSCLIEPSEIPKIEIDFFIPIDKVVHFCMYFGLAFVIALNYIIVNKGKIIILRLICFATLAPIIYGGMIEILQERYFNRSGDWSDFLANTIGTICVLPIALYIKQYVLRKYRN